MEIRSLILTILENVMIFVEITSQTRSLTFFFFFASWSISVIFCITYQTVIDSYGSAEHVERHVPRP